MRKYFSLPSQSLDYISKMLGFGGKDKMEFEDWANIQDFDLIKRLVDTGSLTEKQSEVLFKKSIRKVYSDGRAAIKKMIAYNKKDVLDTENILTRVLPYIQLTYRANSGKKELSCINCNKSNIIATKIINKGANKWQQFYCNDCEGYAGKATFSWDKQRHKKFGRIQ